MKEIFTQLVTLWRPIKPLYKKVSLGLLILVILALSWVLFQATASNYAPLYLDKVSQKELISYLEHHLIPYRIDPRKGVLIPTADFEAVFWGLGQAAPLKQAEHKGFELFDTNTWIKGEKELQVLEMRALKGQLEKDLSSFESVQDASVILDIPPHRTFNGPQCSSKASVILTLMPNALLSTSTLKAITCHVTGAVRGLEPHMIAISDTKGRLYQSFDSEKKNADRSEEARHLEEVLYEKMTPLLSHLLGKENVYLSIQLMLGEKEIEQSFLSVALMINQNCVNELNEETLRADVGRQLMTVAQGYGLTVTPIIDFIPFKGGPNLTEKEKEESGTSLIFTLMMVAVTLLALIYFYRRFKKNQGLEEENLFQLMTRIDVKKLADSIQHEDPQTIALMLSYLETSGAEKMIAALKSDLQEAVLFHLSELEKESL